ncbi:MAG TPA: DinB family protein [Candidatus Limnocylindria bacterium]|nr:DinB family protein [Candidatus Limnocylindria bacterium]
MTVGPPVNAPLRPDDVALLLESTCALIESEMRALGDDGCRFHFASGEWCVNECVGHLIEAERRGFAGRIRDILAGRPLHAWDQAEVAGERKDCERVSQSLWMEFMGLRHDSIALVRSLTAADLDRSGTHPTVGELRVRDLLHEWVHHDRNHTRQLLAVQQERVYPHMANAQKFVGE